MSSNCHGSDLNYYRLLECNTAFFHEEDEVSKQGFSKIGSSGAWYFDVPPRFKGNRVTSYGGKLSFKIKYDWIFDEYIQQNGFESSDIQPLKIIINSSEIDLMYVHDEPFNPNQEYDVTVILNETNFKRYPDNAIITRDHMLIALTDVHSIMISASYVKSQLNTAISQLSIDIARKYEDLTRATQETAYLVEICKCPEGYNGTSCESCTEGYQKKKVGQLVKCFRDCHEFCYGNSNNCDERKCYNCENNTTGDRCELCAEGFGGNAMSDRRKCYKRKYRD
jgi:dystroglycan 1